MTPTTATLTDLVAVCYVNHIPRSGGVAALVGDTQIAVFMTDDGTVHALENRDPFTGANVLSRGIVGSHGGRTTVASPLRKQRYDLVTGECLDDPTVRLLVHEASVSDGQVSVRLTKRLAVARDADDITP